MAGSRDVGADREMPRMKEACFSVHQASALNDKCLCVFFVLLSSYCLFTQSNRIPDLVARRSGDSDES